MLRQNKHEKAKDMKKNEESEKNHERQKDNLKP